ncbi:hypothetical protein [uncultured Phenylobacterium sp.]|uniref:hypothetical protein n=1 Tax=uncultured Phenylobacterium sp. TaxID=349273 RepID=UPI0025D5DCB2|nr:hypothetical protein [uncultured Phenylobacterium sp.]
MTETAVARTDRELQMLETMVDCAFALGSALGEAAKAEPDTKRYLSLVDAFQRSFLAVRMGIRLSLTLRASPKPTRPAAIERDPPEVERAEVERAETDGSDGLERERERDYEPVSLPRFLATLGVVARDTARLEGLPEEVRTHTLPALAGLLARAKTHGPASPPPQPAAKVDVLIRPPPGAPRSRLLGSAAAFAPKAGSPAGHRLPRPPPRGSG